jgi:excisionase family DNA binding protein
MPRKVKIFSELNDVPALFPTGDRRKIIDLKELSELSGIAIPTLREWIRSGTIGGAFQRKKNAKWRFRRERLEAWWEALLQKHNFPVPNRPQFSGVNIDQQIEHLELPPQFDLIAAAYQKGYQDAIAKLTQQGASGELGPFNKHYPPKPPA